MKPEDYNKCADRIVAALKLEPAERVLLKLDPRCFGNIVEPIQKRIRAAGAHISGVILAEDTRAESESEFESIRALFAAADVFIWLPELHQGNRPAVSRALIEWLDARRGRSVHFHWNSGTYPIRDLGLPPRETVDRMYLDALDVPPDHLARLHRQAIQILRTGPVRVTTPEGTDITFVTGDRPFSSQTGDASRFRAASWRTRIDRDVELPAGVLRIAPIESSANGTLVLPVWRPILSEGRDIVLRFVDGRAAIEGVNADQIAQELTAAGGDARRFREFALGFNPALKVRPEHPFIAYYGYGAGIVRLSLGDNEEMGGANRGGGVYWNFLHNATVRVGSKMLVQDGILNENAI
jgi:leucyl aminopeptidase (aminopeptidase T)